MNKRILIIAALLLLAFGAKPVYAQEVAMSDPSAKTKTTLVDIDQRPRVLREYLAAKNSPFTDEAGYFVKEADRLNLDWKLVTAIAGVESTFGAHIPTNSYNAWGWGVFTGTSDGVHFAGWKDGITHVSEGLRYNYFDKGAKTVEQVGRIYAASPVWAYKVKWFLNDIEAFQPKALAVTI